ncbi:ubiquitin-activating enzyme E1 C [Schistosoma japonicum]|nr:ubiquitin-activating enzyme E1 C [Schistosoma japonicum]
MKMSAITEESETSVKIQRYAGDHSSLVGSESLFKASIRIDVTNNHLMKCNACSSCFVYIHLYQQVENKLYYAYQELLPYDLNLKTVVSDVTEIFHQPCPPTKVAPSSIRYVGDES